MAFVINDPSEPAVRAIMIIWIIFYSLLLVSEVALLVRMMFDKHRRFELGPRCIALQACLCICMYYTSQQNTCK